MPPRMELRDHVSTTGGALKRWLIATAYDAACVGLMWLTGLLILRVPLAPLWAVLAVFLQFIPGAGGVLALAGPAMTAALTGGTEKMFLVLGLYALIVVIDGLLLQPLFMKGMARVPFWMSLIAPIVLGILIPFWGVLLSAPLLAVVYAYKARAKAQQAAVPAPPDHIL